MKRYPVPEEIDNMIVHEQTNGLSLGELSRKGKQRKEKPCVSCHKPFIGHAKKCIPCQDGSIIISNPLAHGSDVCEKHHVVKKLFHVKGKNLRQEACMKCLLETDMLSEYCVCYLTTSCRNKYVKWYKDEYLS